MNALTHANVFVEDKLFSTLDPTTRRLGLLDGSVVLLSDTVGFIRKLPPTIVSAFKATLEELAEASMLLHVVDITSHNASEQCQIVEGILADLGLKDKPRLTALNKIDLLLNDGQNWDETTALKYLSDQHEPADEGTVLVSAVKRWGLWRLLELVSRTLSQTRLPV
jgi:GTP-binding protein HflX